MYMSHPGKSTARTTREWRRHRCRGHWRACQEKAPPPLQRNGGHPGGSTSVKESGFCLRWIGQLDATASSYLYSHLNTS